METAYQSPAGPIAPIDMIYGHRASIARGNHFMAHKCGFTMDSLVQSFKQAGFETVGGIRLQKSFELRVIASKRQRSKDEMMELAKEYL
ncbi:hypothetical protein [Desulfoglaeba alkanexedens]|uniref:Uncharacterized protein n=1 Tax=Desulfoglaeba alkanexedens ALDC TaxID=980445 RepID=A0A4P8L1A5_9BACT|nr:hypothetical protein [Desulfoglaeba alkanexedens]QCQ21343.1 hypothetical protein FDQ92_03600 [Desulfoglaeba alkanexedens ALDC]